MWRCRSTASPDDDVRRDRVKLGPRGEDGLKEAGGELLVATLDERFDVDDRSTAEGAAPADELADQLRVGPGGDAVTQASADEPHCVQRPGGRSVRGVERPAETELVETERHAAGNRSAHAAALDDERHARPAGGLSKSGQNRMDSVGHRRSLRLGGYSSCAVGRIRISLRVIRCGRLTANAITSATSSAGIA